jgi:hypothetical protein
MMPVKKYDFGIDVTSVPMTPGQSETVENSPPAKLTTLVVSPFRCVIHVFFRLLYFLQSLATIAGRCNIQQECNQVISITLP